MINRHFAISLSTIILCSVALYPPKAIAVEVRFCNISGQPLAVAIAEEYGTDEHGEVDDRSHSYGWEVVSIDSCTRGVVIDHDFGSPYYYYHIRNAWGVVWTGEEGTEKRRLCASTKDEFDLGFDRDGVCVKWTGPFSAWTWGNQPAAGSYYAEFNRLENDQEVLILTSARKVVPELSDLEVNTSQDFGETGIHEQGQRQPNPGVVGGPLEPVMGGMGPGGRVARRILTPDEGIRCDTGEHCGRVGRWTQERADLEFQERIERARERDRALEAWVENGCIASASKSCFQ